MAEENVDKNDVLDEIPSEKTEFEVKKPLLDAFKDLFKSTAALPGEIKSRHKTTNVDMRTEMSFRSIKENIMKKVENFFQAVYKIGSSKKEESPNKYAANANVGKSTEKTKNDENVVSQQPIHVPVALSEKARKTENIPHSAPILENVVVNKDIVQEVDKIKSTEDIPFELDSSTDDITFDSDDSTKNRRNSSVDPNAIVMSEMTVSNQPEVANIITPKSKNTIIKGKKEASERSGMEL